MSAPDREVVRRMAELACLEVRPDQEAEVQRDLSRILDWVAALRDLPSGPELASVEAVGVSLREDVVAPGGLGAALIEAAPEAADGLLRVPLRSAP